MSRRANVRVRYQLDDTSYESELAIVPSDGRIETAPALERCALTNPTAPTDCLVTCALSGTRAMKHRLARSEASGRYALPEQVVDRTLLKTCAVSGRKGEPAHFGQCSFTKADVLNERLGQSEVSGKSYRLDQEAVFAISGRRGDVPETKRLSARIRRSETQAETPPDTKKPAVRGLNSQGRSPFRCLETGWWARQGSNL